MAEALFLFASLGSRAMRHPKSMIQINSERHRYSSFMYHYTLCQTYAGARFLCRALGER